MKDMNNNKQANKFLQISLTNNIKISIKIK